MAPDATVTKKDSSTLLQSTGKQGGLRVNATRHHQNIIPPWRGTSMVSPSLPPKARGQRESPPSGGESRGSTTTMFRRFLFRSTTRRPPLMRGRGEGSSQTLRACAGRSVQEHPAGTGATLPGLLGAREPWRSTSRRSLTSRFARTSSSLLGEYSSSTKRGRSIIYITRSMLT